MEKYIVLIASFEELLKDKEEVLLRGYDTQPLINKLNKTKAN